MRKVLSVILLLFASIVFATWQYRLACVLLALWITRKRLNEKLGRRGFRGLMVGLLMAIFIAVPNYFQRGRTQLVYMNEKGEKTKTPLSIYLLNAIFPEEELMNAGMKATAILPNLEQAFCLRLKLILRQHEEAFRSMI